MNINCYTVTGRVTAEPNFKYTEKELAILNFRIAVNDRRTKTAMFLNVVCFGQQAENISDYVTKGTLLGVVGPLKIEEYEVEGEKRTSVCVTAEHIELGPKPKSEE